MLNKKLAIISIIIITIFSFLNISNAETTETFELYLETSNKKVEPGKQFSVDIVLDNMEVTSGDQGIAAYFAKIIYDTDILELVSVKSDNWEVMENEGNMVANTKDGEVVKEKTITAQAIFKVKDNAKTGKTTITLDSIEGSSGTTTIQGTTRNLEMQIVINKPNNNTAGNTTGNTAGNTTGNTTGNATGNTAGNTTGNTIGNTTGNNINGNGINTNKNIIAGNNSQSTSKQPTLPYAGVRNVVMGIAVVIVVIAIYFYIKYRRAYDEKK